MKDNKFVLCPIWLLKQKVETDFEEYAFLVGSGGVELDEEDQPEEFPIYDSTMEVIKILEDVGLEFDTKTGQWIE